MKKKIYQKVKYDIYFDKILPIGMKTFFESIKNIYVPLQFDVHQILPFFIDRLPAQTGILTPGTPNKTFN